MVEIDMRKLRETIEQLSAVIDAQSVRIAELCEVRQRLRTQRDHLVTIEMSVEAITQLTTLDPPACTCPPEVPL